MKDELGAGLMRSFANILTVDGVLARENGTTYDTFNRLRIGRPTSGMAYAHSRGAWTGAFPISDIEWMFQASISG